MYPNPAVSHECEQLAARLLALQLFRYAAGYIEAVGTFEDGTR